MTKTFLTTKELSERIKYPERCIREYLKDRVLIEGVHYIRPFGRRKLLFLWESIENDLIGDSVRGMDAIPLAGGGFCNV